MISKREKGHERLLRRRQAEAESLGKGSLYH